MKTQDILVLCLVGMLVVSVIGATYAYTGHPDDSSGMMGDAPLRMDSDSELEEMASSGSGTEADPFVIEGYDIDGTGYGYGIYIGNTTAHFEVRNNRVSNASGNHQPPYYAESGIYLYKVQNGKILGNIITGNRNGITLYCSKDCTVNHNTITENSEVGIYMDHEHPNDYPYSNQMGHNHISNNGFAGIFMANAGTQGGNRVHNNTVVGNSFAADHVAHEGSINLWGGYSKNNLIENNFCDNNINGLHFRASGIADNIIRGNTVVNNTRGIYYTHGAGPNIFYNNNFINNTAHTISTHADDLWGDGNPAEGGSGGNYWDDYQDKYPDAEEREDAPGIWDTPYEDGNVLDDYPLMEPRVPPSPVYHIYDVWDLQSMRFDLHGDYTLMKDIDASMTMEWNDGAGFVPVGTDANRFTGSFHGRNHTIKGLYINRPDTNDVGLFGYLGEDGVVSNAGMLDADVRGNNSVGALVGMNHKGTVDNSHASGQVDGTNNVGGLVGKNGGKIYRSYAAVDVTGSAHVGGLVGMDDSHPFYYNIIRCYATGSVQGSFEVGGLVGRSYGRIRYCYATGDVGVGQRVGGFVGYSSSEVIYASYSTGQVTGYLNVGGFAGQSMGTNTAGCYWDVETSGTETSWLGIGKTTAEMMMQETFSGSVWNFEDNWWMVDGDTRPFLQMEYRTEISNSHQLQMMAMDLDADYVLVNDVDCSDITNAASMWGSTETSGRGFFPVGTLGSIFTGHLDGQGYVISNLHMRRTTDRIGLFGRSDGTIENIKLEDLYVRGRQFTGGLAGQNTGSIINCHVNGEVVSSSQIVGGLVGSNSGLISSSSSSGEGVSSSQNVAGGLVGSNAATGNIIDSRSSMDVAGGNREYMGGLVGRNYGAIERSFATGDVTGNGRIGGLAGQNDGGTIADCYAHGDVRRTGVGSDIRCGGFVGNNNEGSIVNSYSTGKVTYANAVDPTDKGFAGDVSTGGNYEMTGNFWDMETSGQTSTAGEAIGKTTAEMMDITIFADASWDIAEILSHFSEMWFIHQNNDYPRLWWERSVEVDHIVIVPMDVTVTAGETVSYSAHAYDADGNLLISIPYGTTWSIDLDAEGSWIAFDYTSAKAGTWTVRGTYRVWSNETSLTVTAAGVSYVETDPDEDQTIISGDTIQFSTRAYDPFDNLITDVSSDFQWANTTSEGLFSETVPGEYVVTAEYNGISSGPVNVTVVPITHVSLMMNEEADGWNFVSFDLILDNTDLESILADIEGNYDRVMWYGAFQGEWQTYVPGRADHFNTLQTWDHTMGIWIRVTENVTISLVGELPDTTDITLYPGWNMVGLPSNSPGNHGLPAEVTMVGYFDASMEYNVAYTDDVAAFEFEPGRGYWVYNGADTPVIWAVDY